MEGKFINNKNVEIDGSRAISPLFTIINGKTQLLGTTFFITGNGVMLTAKHCLFDSAGKSWENLFIAQFDSENRFYIRGIQKSYWNQSDVAILVPDRWVHKTSGEDMQNPIPALTLKPCTIGEKIVSFAYPKTTVLEQPSNTLINVDTTWHSGEIEDFHENGFSLIKNPCYQTSMYIMGGSSGGPVANSLGQIFAINSSGSDMVEGIKPYSFLSPIECCFDIQLEDSNGERVTLRQLAEKLIIQVV